MQCKIDVFLGHVELEQKMEPVDGGVITYGRSKWYDRDGYLVEVTEWSPLGKLFVPEAHESEGLFWGVMRKIRDVLAGKLPRS